MKRLKIALIGYGKMGRMIEKIAESRGHHIVARIDIGDSEKMDEIPFREADVAIEFTTPKAATDNIFRCFAAGIPVVCGTTGWLDHLPEIKRMATEGAGTLLYASNFSIGVNIFMAVNKYLASLMKGFPQYHASIEEVHHVHKLDHPSGTAITLAEEILSSDPNIHKWEEIMPEQEIRAGVLPIYSRRQGEVTGFHEICWDSEVDTITISHNAKSREGFALGAVMAAEWIAGRAGYFTMSDMLADIFKV